MPGALVGRGVRKLSAKLVRRLQREICTKHKAILICRYSCKGNDRTMCIGVAMVRLLHGLRMTLLPESKDCMLQKRNMLTRPLPEEWAGRDSKVFDYCKMLHGY
eukprot:213703-Amphidinium_carterae.1